MSIRVHYFYSYTNWIDVRSFLFRSASSIDHQPYSILFVRILPCSYFDLKPFSLFQAEYRDARFWSNPFALLGLSLSFLFQISLHNFTRKKLRGEITQFTCSFSMRFLLHNHGIERELFCHWMYIWFAFFYAHYPFYEQAMHMLCMRGHVHYGFVICQQSHCRLDIVLDSLEHVRIYNGHKCEHCIMRTMNIWENYNETIYLYLNLSTDVLMVYNNNNGKNKEYPESIHSPLPQATTRVDSGHLQNWSVSLNRAQLSFSTSEIFQKRILQ